MAILIYSQSFCQKFAEEIVEEILFVFCFHVWLNSPCQTDIPIKRISPSEIMKDVIKLSNNNESPGYVRIFTKVVKVFSEISNNTIFLISYV